MKLPQAYCPHCRRFVAVRSSGAFVTHGPGQGLKTICPGSGKPAPNPDHRSPITDHGAKQP